MFKLQAPVQHLVLRGQGVVPLMPEPYTLVPGDEGFDDNLNIMVAQFALNIDDNAWYYRGRTKIYRMLFTLDDVTAGGNSGIEVFQYNKPYLAGDVFVSFSSVGVGFTTEAIYRCIGDTLAGQSPETHPAKWDKQSEDFEIKVIKISDVEGLEARLSGIENLQSILYKKTLTLKDSTIAIPARANLNYYVEIVSYTSGGWESSGQIEVNSGQGLTSFSTSSEDGVEGGVLIFRIQQLITL